jgi:hypothetical protein
MRFKAKLMSDQLAMFHSVIAPISKLQDPHRFAVLYLDREYIRLSCKTPEGITCFAELSQDELFVEHRIESAADDVIVCQVDLVAMKLAMQSLESGTTTTTTSQNAVMREARQQQQERNNSIFLGQQQCVLKLAKRSNMPCLCLEGRSSADNDVEIHQAIPVIIMRAQEMQNHLPPQINHPQVQLELPPMNRAPIRAVVDKLKGMAKCVLLEGTMKGDLTIRIDHDGASMACFYNGLIPRWQDDDDVNENASSSSNTRQMFNANTSCILKVDTNKLSTCLQWQQNQLPMTSCLLGMVYNEMLVLHVLLAPEQVGFFTYYLPVHFLQEDEDMGTG